MEAINIPQLLKKPNQTQLIEFQESIPNFDTLTPVRGQIAVKHRGNFLEVFAKAEAIVTLTCHRCLQQYNHRLSIDTSEIIWLDATDDETDNDFLERETPLEDLVETLPPQGDFPPETWLYEQLCLALPPRQLCDNNCPGISPSDAPALEMPSDRRWNALEVLKQQLRN